MMLDKLDANGVSIFSFKKDTFANRLFNLMVVCRKQSLGPQEFSQLMHHLQAAYFIDIIGDFNYDLLKKIEKKLLDIFTDQVPVNKPTFTSKFS